MQIKEYKNIDMLNHEISEFIFDLINKTIKHQDFFNVTFYFGNLYGKIYYNLKEGERKLKIEWNKVLVSWGDDRYLSHTNLETNYSMAFETLLNKINILQENIFGISTEVSTQEKTALLYETIMKKIFLNFCDWFKLNKKMLIIFGVEKDAHIAFLFTKYMAVNENIR